MANILSLKNRKPLRHQFGVLQDIADMPNLIEIQKSSYQQLLTSKTIENQESHIGIHDALASVFPIKDYQGRMTLKYISYKLDRPKYDVIECRQRGLTYAAALKVIFRLDIIKIDEETNQEIGKDAREEEVYLGDIPLMTDKATFVINGTERVIVSQMHRSPGVFFDASNAARVIPYRGSWLDVEFDAKNLLFFRIDRRKKLSLAFLLKSMGLDNEGILSRFYNSSEFNIKENNQISILYDFEELKGELNFDLINADNNEILLSKGERLTNRHNREFEEKKITNILVPDEAIFGKYLANDIFNKDTGEIFGEAGDEIDEKLIDLLRENKLSNFSVLITSNKSGAYIRNTIIAEKDVKRADALASIYKIMRPGEPPTEESSEKLFYDLFFSRIDTTLDELNFYSSNSKKEKSRKIRQ